MNREDRALLERAARGQVRHDAEHRHLLKTLARAVLELDQQPDPKSERIGSTERGFGIYMQDFNDLNDQLIQVSESSLATQPAVRIYVGDGPEGGCAHLSIEQARAVRDGLSAYLAEQEGSP